MEIVKKGNGAASSGPIAGPIEETGPTCATCPHWYRRMDLNKGTGGDCRYESPKGYFIPVAPKLDGAPMGIGFQSMFPGSQEDTWCSNHPERLALVRAGIAVDVLEIVADEFPRFGELMTQAGMIYPDPGAEPGGGRVETEEKS